MSIAGAALLLIRSHSVVLSMALVARLVASMVARLVASMVARLVASMVASMVARLVASMVASLVARLVASIPTKHSRRQHNQGKTSYSKLRKKNN